MLRNGLVVVEVALSLMLLVGAGLMIRTFMAVQDVELGFRTDRLLTMRVPLPEQRYPDRERRVAFSGITPPRERRAGRAGRRIEHRHAPDGNFNTPVEVVGSAQPDTRPVVIHQINTDYTKALGIALVEGRLFAENEVSGGRQLAIVNQSFVRAASTGATRGAVVRVPRLKQPRSRLRTTLFRSLAW